MPVIIPVANKLFHIARADVIIVINWSRSRNPRYIPNIFAVSRNRRVDHDCNIDLQVRALDSGQALRII